MMEHTKMNRGTPSGPSNVAGGGGQARTQIYTRFTKANGVTELLYSPENWIRIRLTLETAGPVAVGTSNNLSPVLTGRGILLLVNEEIDFVIAKGDKVYIVADTINRVKVIIEPIPWLQQLTFDVSTMAGKIGNIIRGLR